MTITKLINPRGKSYRELKNFVLGSDINWEWLPQSTGQLQDCFDEEDLKDYFEKSEIPLTDLDKYQDMPLYSHCVIDRISTYEQGYPHEDLHPGSDLVPIIKSHSYDLVKRFLYDVLVANKNECYIKCIMRCNFNAVHSDIQGLSVPHEDHNSEVIPHKNMLVYFTDAGGETFVGMESYSPKEDDIIVFDSSKLHYMRAPKSKRRVIMVLTYI
jgi:hypothetical protein